MKTTHNSIKTLAILLLCTFTLSNSLLASYTLVLTNNRTVDGPQILLKDLVADPSVLPTGWGDRKVMSAPSPGKPAEYTLASIAGALQKYPDMQDVTLRGQFNINIKRTGSDLSFENISDAIKQFVKTDSSWNKGSYDVICDPLETTMLIPTGETSIEIVNYIPQKKQDYYLFNLTVGVGDAEPQSISLYATILPLAKIWTAKTPMIRGQVISPSDLEANELPFSATRNYVSIEQNIVGMEVNRALRSGEPITEHTIDQPLCAERGDRISVNADRGDLRVQANATALATGRRGDRILCMNDRSSRRFLVRLTGTREATIDF